jgi:hypothetical protein
MIQKILVSIMHAVHVLFGPLRSRISLAILANETIPSVEVLPSGYSSACSHGNIYSKV